MRGDARAPKEFCMGQAISTHKAGQCFLRLNKGEEQKVTGSHSYSGTMDHAVVNHAT